MCDLLQEKRCRPHVCPCVGSLIQLGSPNQELHGPAFQCSDKKQYTKRPLFTRVSKQYLKGSSCDLKKQTKLQVAQRAIEGLVFFWEAFLRASQLGFHSVWKLTPISNVIKISEHFLLFFWKYPGFTRWSEDRCFGGKFIIKITNVFSSSNGGYKRRLHFLGQ